MSAPLNPDKKLVVRGPELALNMVFDAVTTFVPTTSLIVVGGKAYKQADLLKAIDDMRAPLVDARTAKAVLRKARADMRDKLPEIELGIRELRTGIRAFLGENNPEIEKFGFKAVGARRQLTSEEKVQRAEKVRRTREARHTMGSKQKEAVTGASLPPATQAPKKVAS